MHRFNSFACERRSCNAKYFIDGKEYFDHLYITLSKCKESVYICGWMVSPELPLKRGNNIITLKDVLLDLAKRGVKICILIWNEFSLGSSTNSSYTKNTLNALHSNIKVIRHPKGNLQIYWSHHEKMVIIDQTVGYVGGIDLCWGRYDTNQHSLSDTHGLNFPGIDYCNFRIKDFEDVARNDVDCVNRLLYPRMPWHDITVSLEGSVVQDLTRHFIERWNFAQASNLFEGNQLNISNFISSKDQTSNTKRKVQNGPNMKRSALDLNMIELVDIEGNTISRPNSQMFSAKARTIGDDNLDNELHFGNNRPKQDSGRGSVSGIINKLSNFKDSIIRGSILIKKQMIQETKLIKNSPNKDQIGFQLVKSQQSKEVSTSTCQIIRSAAYWSVGIDKRIESSILEAYYDLIDESKHFIYIENQFFISCSIKDDLGSELIKNE